MNPNKDQAGNSQWHCWKLPFFLERDEAYRFFMDKVKPAEYDFEKFKYDPKRGVAMTA